jgi:hypothetical protein
MLIDVQWKILETLVEQCRPNGKTPPQSPRRTVEAILWRSQNGAKGRVVPSEMDPWRRAA